MSHGEGADGSAIVYERTGPHGRHFKRLYRSWDVYVILFSSGDGTKLVANRNQSATLHANRHGESVNRQFLAEEVCSIFSRSVEAVSAVRRRFHCCSPHWCRCWPRLSARCVPEWLPSGLLPCTANRPTQQSPRPQLQLSIGSYPADLPHTKSRRSGGTVYETEQGLTPRAFRSLMASHCDTDALLGCSGSCAADASLPSLPLCRERQSRKRRTTSKQ